MRGDDWIDHRQVEVPRLLDALGIAYTRRGSQLTARCPFHEDKDPSWAIRDAPGDGKNGKHRCMSCGEHGGVVKLASTVLGIDFENAARWIAQGGFVDGSIAGGLSLDVSDPLAAPKQTLKMPPGVHILPLDRWTPMPRRYALSRGLIAEQVDRWRIGYAVDGWLGGRIVIPVRDEDGVLVSYEARSFLGAPRKYKRPSRAEGGPSWAIFGTEFWRDASTVIVTEGALNALACERAGARAVAAICGSTLDPNHVLEITTRFDDVVIATDPDKAGERATLDLVGSFGRWKNVRIAQLPSGKDCVDVLTLDSAESLAAILGVG